MSPRQRLAFLFGLVALGAGLGLAAPSAAQNCGSDSGYLINFVDLPGDSPAIGGGFLLGQLSLCEA